MAEPEKVNTERPHRPPLQKRLTLTHLWLGLPVFLLICKSLVFPLPLLDFWWHLKMGEIIVGTKSIPRTDIFSFTAAGQPFIAQNWLTEVLYYLVYRLGGFALLICFNVALLVAAFLPVYKLCREASARLWIAVLSGCVVAFGMYGNMRPQVVSFVLFSTFLWILHDFRDRGKDRLWPLPVLMLLWVNLHGAFVVGLGLILLFLAAESLRSVARPAAEGTLSTRRLGKLALILALCLVATLLNPEGYGIYSYIQTVMNDPSSRQFVIEWQPPRVDTLQGALLFFFPFFLTTVVLICSRLRPNLTDLALFMGFAVFGLTSTRNAIWFVLVNGPLLAGYLGNIDWSPAEEVWIQLRSRVGLPVAARHGVRRARSIPSLNLLIAAAGLLIIVLFSPWIQSRYYNTSLVDAKTPVRAVDYLEAHAIEGFIFHPQIYGDYLIWRLWPNQRSFFDGRVHLFGEDLVSTYQQVFRDSHWEDILAKFKITYLLLDKDGDVKRGSQRIIDTARSSPAWRLIYEDRLSVIFAREEVKTSLAQSGP